MNFRKTPPQAKSGPKRTPNLWRSWKRYSARVTMRLLVRWSRASRLRRRVNWKESPLQPLVNISTRRRVEAKSDRLASDLEFWIAFQFGLEAWIGIWRHESRCCIVSTQVYEKNLLACAVAADAASQRLDLDGQSRHLECKIDIRKGKTSCSTSSTCACRREILLVLLF